MFRVRSKRSILRAAVAFPVAALLLTGCGGDNDEPAASSAPAPETATPEPTTATPQSSGEALDQLTAQLEKAGEQAGPEGFGALACESVKGGILGAQKADEKATAEAVGLVLDSILTGARRSSDSVDDADIDATMKKQCPDVHEDALKATGSGSLQELL